MDPGKVFATQMWVPVYGSPAVVNKVVTPQLRSVTGEPEVWSCQSSDIDEQVPWETTEEQSRQTPRVDLWPPVISCPVWYWTPETPALDRLRSKDHVLKVTFNPEVTSNALLPHRLKELLLPHSSIHKNTYTQLYATLHAYPTHVCSHKHKDIHKKVEKDWGKTPVWTSVLHTLKKA